MCETMSCTHIIILFKVRGDKMKCPASLKQQNNDKNKYIFGWKQ